MLLLIYVNLSFIEGTLRLWYGLMLLKCRQTLGNGQLVITSVGVCGQMVVRLLVSLGVWCMMVRPAG